ncbi:hypothetical protein BO94DRAFT_516226 [Aspergillus sclerotioniger CBS 115572]|uniref:Uncharacterized protein n=1 Tax=Aspergillus sclerotioniger CBS 115572 TaxID=1450535 RepID=A0A317WN97_9EURO|nr:hypothetical protein BO94DRAFT_516226 [Aspergillus sclerotioniger CBS 115572]PWY87924.1 hypothetical protein BO94DRAFT_516226 [Aspergillus sclerotioniger CBS 115572]
MMQTTLPTMPFESPKRKRASSEESDYCSPSASPTSCVSIPNLQETRVREAEEWGRYSPRAVVASRLGQLAIRGDQFSTSPVPYGADPSLQLGDWPATYDELHGTRDIPGTNPSMEGSPSPAGFTEFAKGIQPCDSDKSASTSPSKKRSTPSPRKKRIPSITSKMRSVRSSPPLISNTAEDPLTWHDSEITGHNPTDPTDDGYGMNGIGFKPTAAMAWARSQRRQKQVAEWKNREAREARERRRERRDGADFDKIRTIQSGAIQKKVKFDV